MSDYTSKQSHTGATHDASNPVVPSPGKHTLVEQVYRPVAVVQRQPVEHRDATPALVARAAWSHGDQIQRLFGRHDAPPATSPSGGDLPPVSTGSGPRVARDACGVAGDADQAIAAASGSSGEPLPEPVMRKFESSLGADLSSVRVHTGPKSASAAESVGARAYAVGQDIHFAAGQYDPSGTAGQHLLAHEVAHTVQQGGNAPVRQNKLEVSSPGDAAENEADRAADAMVSGAPASITAAGSMVARDPAKEPPKAKPGDEGKTPSDPPDRYKQMSKDVLDLLWRSAGSWERLQGKDFWAALDDIGVADLQTMVQVVKGARKAGVTIDKLAKKGVYTNESSWGLEFIGGTPPLGYPDWGKDVPQLAVRWQHEWTSHTWYRQNTGAGKPGMHFGLDAGYGANNLHFDPTNPMERVSDGKAPAYWVDSPVMMMPPVSIFGKKWEPPKVPVVIPAGLAIYSPEALSDHLKDIKVLGGSGGPKAESENQPWLDIAILSRDFAEEAHGRANNEAGDPNVKDRARANIVITNLHAAANLCQALGDEARALAMQDMEGATAKIEDLKGKRDTARMAMFSSFAALYQHMHQEVDPCPASLRGPDSPSAFQVTADSARHNGWPKWLALANERTARATKKAP